MLSQNSVGGKDFGFIIIDECYNNFIQMTQVSDKNAAKIARLNCVIDVKYIALDLPEKFVNKSERPAAESNIAPGNSQYPRSVIKPEK